MVRPNDRYGRDAPRQSFRYPGVPTPATFVVGRDGVVKARFVDPDFRRRVAVEESITALKAAGQPRQRLSP